MVEELKNFLNNFNISYKQINSQFYINPEDAFRVTNLLVNTHNPEFIYYALYYLKNIDQKYLIDEIINLNDMKHIYLCSREFNYPSYDIVKKLSYELLDPEVLYWRACEEENAPLEELAKLLNYCNELEWIYAFCVEYPEYLDYFFYKFIKSDDLDFLRNLQYIYSSRLSLKQNVLLNNRINEVLNCDEKYSYSR